MEREFHPPAFCVVVSDEREPTNGLLAAVMIPIEQLEPHFSLCYRIGYPSMGLLLLVT